MLPLCEPLILHYPTETRINSALDFRPRRLMVYKLRDLVTDPLTPEEYLRRPMIYRGRFLAMARTEDGFRRFYATTAKEHFRVVPLRLALYSPDRPTMPVTIVSREFGATVADRLALARCIALASRRDLGDLMLRVVADDLRLITAEAG